MSLIQKMTKAFVLIVEDNIDNMLVLTELLNVMPEVSYSKVRPSGRQLFALLENDTVPAINLILLDINLPRENGYVLLPKIRAHPKLSNAVVIAVSAQSEPQEVAKMRAAGFDGFLAKPLHFQRFPDQLRRIMNGEQIWEGR